ncbi:hypothetical protein CEXT_639491 [Caerostris extrusa]|uniref:Uncharacterized protein n=1 Tax=Caerostris extrusa TaxID=172846 RepID=A0AAV4QL28_CAEEX|nr:hypothetical protein CEXT_639491 [Caerostris extrusa]
MNGRWYSGTYGEGCCVIGRYGIHQPIASLQNDKSDIVRVHPILSSPFLTRVRHKNSIFQSRNCGAENGEPSWCEAGNEYLYAFMHLGRPSVEDRLIKTFVISICETFVERNWNDIYCGERFCKGSIGIVVMFLPRLGSIWNVRIYQSPRRTCVIESFLFQIDDCFVELVVRTSISNLKV